MMEAYKQLEEAYSYLNQFNRTHAEFCGTGMLKIHEWRRECLSKKEAVNICDIGWLKDKGVERQNFIELYEKN